MSTDTRALLAHTASCAADFLEGLPARPVAPSATVDALRAALGGPVPEQPRAPQEVVDGLLQATRDGVLGSTSGRFFGFVIGGCLPVALAADWLTSTWDQNAGLYVAGPAASVVEEVCGRWIAEMLGLPSPVSFAFVTGCQMAHFTALAAARHHLLEQAGWDVESQGLWGAPPIGVFVGQERHVTVDRALRFLGMGTAHVRVVPADDQGRMRPDALAEALRGHRGAAIVCAQAGNVNTGAFDPLERVAAIGHAAGAWVHVDGAFGMWAAAAPALRHLTQGLGQADSWAMDAHKWLNVPQDSGLAFVAHPAAHRAAMSHAASYLQYAEAERDQVDWTPEFSRRARGFCVYAALRCLGRAGVAGLVESSCAHARRFATALARLDGIAVLNDVVLNQVLVRCLDPAGQHDERTRAVLAAVQREGECWMSGTTWQGHAAMRISVTNWSTSETDVDRSVAAIARALASTRPPGP